MKQSESDVREIFEQSLPMPSQEQTDVTCERVLKRLNAVESSAEILAMPSAVTTPSKRWWRLTPLRTAVALSGLLVLALPFIKALVFPEPVYSTVERANGSLYRVLRGKSEVVKVGDKILAGTPVRSEDGAVLKLVDGARIEMRPKSELSLERTRDGVRIRLNDGSVSVTPSRQPSGNLYVQNREWTVPVTGAVVEWAVTPIEPEPRFEAVSIRRSLAPVYSGPRAGGTAPGTFAAPVPAEAVCPPSTFQVNPGRFVATGMSVYGLIAVAYGNLCPPPDVVTGGPDWIKTDRYEVQAIIPEGSTPYTRQELLEGRAPKLQAMIQKMLAERFKLSVREESKEMQGFALVVATEGKLKLSEDQTGDTMATAPKPDFSKPRGPFTFLPGMSMQRLANFLQGRVGHPVIDKTGTKGLYDFFVTMPEPLSATRGNPDYMKQIVIESNTELPKRLEEQFGLKLEPAQVQVEVRIIDRVERPSEN